MSFNKNSRETAIKRYADFVREQSNEGTLGRIKKVLNELFKDSDELN